MACDTGDWLADDKPEREAVSKDMRDGRLRSNSGSLGEATDQSWSAEELELLEHAVKKVGLPRDEVELRLRRVRNEPDPQIDLNSELSGNWTPQQLRMFRAWA